MTQFDLLTYPNAPGWKRGGTSAAAAEAMKPKAPVVRDRVLNALHQCRNGGLTADECAAFLKLDILTVRPRFSELVALDKIEDSGNRRRNASGKSAVVWTVK